MSLSKKAETSRKNNLNHTIEIRNREQVITGILTFPTDDGKSALNDGCNAAIDHDAMPLV